MLEFVVIHRWFMYSNTVTEGGGVFPTDFIT